METQKNESGQRLRRARVGLVVGAMLVLTVLVALVAAPLLVPTDRFLGAAESLASEALDRPVSIGSLQVSLLPPSIVLHEVRVGASAEEAIDALASFERVVAHVSPLPLFLRRLEVPRVTIHGGSIRLERSLDGTFAAMELLELPAPLDVEPAWDIGLGEVLFRRLAIELVDLHVTPGQIVISQAHDARGSIIIGTVGEPITIDLRAALFEDRAPNFEVEGRVPRRLPARTGAAPSRVGTREARGEYEVAGGSFPLDLRVRAYEVPTNHLAAYIGELAPYLPRTLSVQLTLSGDLQRTVQAEGFLETGEVITMIVSGEMDLREAPPRMAIDFEVPSFRLGEMLQAIPALRRAVPNPFVAEGSAQIRGRMSGDIEQLNGSAWLESEGLQLRTGAFALDDEEAPPGFLFEVHELFANLEHRAIREGRSRWGLDVVASRALFDLEPAESTDRQPPDIPNILLSGSVRVEAGRFMTLELQDLTGTFSVVRQRIRVQPRLRTHGGFVQASLDMDLARSPLTGRLELEVTGVQAESLLEDTAPDLEAPLTGALDAELQVDWRGFDFEAFRATAQGQGSVFLRGGRVTTLDLEPEIAEVMRQVAETIGVAPPQELTEPTLRDLQADFVVEDGAVRAEVIEVRGTYTRILAGGALGLDMSLDLAGSFAFSPRAADRFGPIGQVLRGPDGWLSVPFSIGGTVDEPEVSIDVGALLERATSDVFGIPDTKWESLRRLWQEQFEGGTSSPSG